MRHIARGDAPTASADAMTRYYTNPGYPPGIWLGRGLAGIADGAGLAAGSMVAEEQMARLFGHAHDPVTDAPLGAPYRTTPPLAERIAAAVDALSNELPAAEREARVAAVTAAEKAKPDRASVAGFDLTFSAPKSVSVLWALSDADVQRAIVDAHHAAIAVVIGLIERDVARTRVGHAGAARVPLLGLIAAGFDHHDSRAGDPQLHTHVTVANRVQAGDDGGWRTVDSQGLYAAAVAHSDTYDALLADNLTRALGLAWEIRLRGRNRNPRRELAVVPDHLIVEFSQRSAAITAPKDDAIEAFADQHHRQPTGPEAVRIRQQATLSTRTPKHASTLRDYLDDWARRASLILGADARGWARDVNSRAAAASVRPVLATAVQVDDAAVERFAAAAMDQVESKRATWSRWNLVAAACRSLSAAGWQFATAKDLLTARDRITRAAIDRSVLLNPATVEAVVDRRDPSTGRSVVDRPEVFTSPEVLAAEDRLLAAADDTSAPTVNHEIVDEVVSKPLAGRDYTLEADQAAGVAAICTSGRVCDVLVGPAGTGKSTTMAGLRTAWEAGHGPGTVIGLATSAVAAEVLGTEIDIVAENTAQWLAQQQLQPGRRDRVAALGMRRDELAAAGRPTPSADRALARATAQYDRWTLHAEQLLVLDEAGMADLHTLDALTDQAKAAGAKILLVGDHAQLPAIGAGGAFGMLARHHSDTPRLTGIRRFRNADATVRTWEADASLRLRDGNPTAVRTYEEHGRLVDGDTAQMIEAGYAAWRVDRAAGLDSLLIAADNNTVQALNLRARADLIAAGTISPDGVLLHDGTTAGVGDVIVTRRVNLHLTDGTSNKLADAYGPLSTGFVKNGTTFTVTAVERDGTLQVRAGAGHPVALPAEYVAEHVELGYAVTTHRCQGMTVDTTHTIATSRMTREAFYVALTRGTRNNRAYITTDPPTGAEDHLAFGEVITDRMTVLAAILANRGEEQSAHEVRRQTQRARRPEVNTILERIKPATGGMAARRGGHPRRVLPRSR